MNRLAGDGGHTIADEMGEPRVKGLHRIAIGKEDHADIELRYRRIRILPPIGKQKCFPALELIILRARERAAPKKGLQLTGELFHKILKSGCQAEDARL